MGPLSPGRNTTILHDTSLRASQETLYEQGVFFLVRSFKLGTNRTGTSRTIGPRVSEYRVGAREDLGAGHGSEQHLHT